jgi:hypothetical protein
MLSSEQVKLLGHLQVAVWNGMIRKDFLGCVASWVIMGNASLTALVTAKRSGKGWTVFGLWPC